MIKNEKQFKITKGKLKDLERSLKVCREGKHPDKTIRKAMLGSIKSMMGDLEKEIKEYEKLKNKKPAIKQKNSPRQIFFLIIVLYILAQS